MDDDTGNFIASGSVFLEPVAYLESDFKSKFGLPRQSALSRVEARIVLCSEYRCEGILRGIEQFSHLWLIWGFDNGTKDWSPTVRPPRLGGNRRVGVFATRSPFRPNPIGLSSVRLLRAEGYTLYVRGADMRDGTSIYDIKPNLRHTDSIADPSDGLAGSGLCHRLTVCDPLRLLDAVPEQARGIIVNSLESDPRPAYIEDPGRVFGMEYAGYDIRFTVEDDVLVIKEVVSSK